MMSKVQSAVDYWTVDVQMTSEVQLAADYIELLTEKPGDEGVLFLVSR